MQTLMSESTFKKLKLIRDELLAISSLPKVAGVFVPWAGSCLQDGGGLYYVGAATDGEYGGEDSQTFEACFARTAEFCNGLRHDRSGTPFWRFLDGLCRGLFAEPYERSASYWGWSNLLKIGGTQGSPGTWRAAIRNRQRDACVDCLQRELALLKNTVVFFGSGETYGILERAIGIENRDSWIKTEEKSGIYWYADQRSGNLYIYGYHPAYAQRIHLFDKQLDAGLKVARQHFERLGV